MDDNYFVYILIGSVVAFLVVVGLIFLLKKPSRQMGDSEFFDFLQNNPEFEMRYWELINSLEQQTDKKQWVREVTYATKNLAYNTDDYRIPFQEALRVLDKAIKYTLSCARLGDIEHNDIRKILAFIKCEDED